MSIMDMLKGYMVTSGQACAILSGHTLFAKMAMTPYRFLLSGDSKTTGPADVKNIENSVSYKRIASTQLNEAEYAPLFVAGLGVLALKGADASLCSTLAVAGQLWYYWTRAAIGNSQEGGVHPPPYLPGAIMRYIAISMMTKELWNAFA